MKTMWIEQAQKQLWSVQQCLEIVLHEGYPADKAEEYAALRKLADEVLAMHDKILKPIAKKNPRYLWDNLEDSCGEKP